MRNHDSSVSNGKGDLDYMEKLAPMQLNFHPTVRQWARIEQLTMESGVPRSVILRRALDAYLEHFFPPPGGLGLVEKESRSSDKK